MDLLIHLYCTNEINMDGGIPIYSTDEIQIEFSINWNCRNKTKMEDDISLFSQMGAQMDADRHLGSICGNSGW